MSMGVLLVACVGIVLQGIFIAVEHKEKYTLAVVLKGLASICFVWIGLQAYMGVCGDSYSRMVLLGLAFGALGDILLNLRFVFESIGQKIFLAGIAAFFTGHILYLVALIPFSQNLWLCLGLGAVAAAALLWVIFSRLQVKPAFKIFGIFYIGAIVMMTAVAIGNYVAWQTTGRLLYVIGAVLFTISDVVLIFNTFGSESRFSMRITNLSCYYAGQLLIAFSLFFVI